jgi:streptogramin lyase
VIESAVVQACGTSQICQGGACLAVSCNTNTDCGADGFVGGRICVGNDVKQNYRTYACSRPGTPSSSCSFSDALTLVMTCAKNCLNGQCTGEYLWMVDTSGKKIYKLDPSNGSVLLSFPAPSKNPTGLTFDGANLWVADKSLKRVYKLNAWGIMINSFPIPVKDSLRGLAFDGKDLWISGTKMIYKISRNGTDFNDSMKGKFYGMTFDGSNIWAVDTKLKKIEKLDASGSVLSSIPIPKGSSSPFGLAYDGVSLWLSDSKKIYRLNPANGAVLSSFNAPAKTKPGDLAFE